jgi:NADH:ubiquinone oxidoreductase subunit 6 (subunit J)
MKTKLSYPLFFLCAVLVFIPFVFLPLNALWLVFKSLVWFGAGKGREDYAAEVWDRTPLAGLSVGFLVLAVFLLISLFVFSRSQRGKRFLAESSGIAEWIARHLFLGLTILFQFFSMLFGFSYRKEDKTRTTDEAQSFRATQDAAIREYEFDERLPDDYGQFLRRLSRIRSEDRKIGYAYRTLCRLYKRAAPEISASDTPREVQRKVERTARFASSDLESARKIIERVKFEDAALEEKTKSGLLSELCRSVRILL